jgi:hypothetical protein
MLYRDVWYHYGPAAPYFNSYLLRLFGIHLNVFYIAGTVAALGSSIFLFLSGIELSFPLAGWTAGAVVLIEAFAPGLFSFPLPYSFPAVYGCLAACLLLWVLLRSLKSASSYWLLAAGSLASVGLLLKLEHGIAFYGLLGLTTILRAVRTRNLKRTFSDLVAIVPGLIACAFVVRWMISIHGVEFITQKNIASWPTSYFMRTYGSAWLAQTGFALDWRHLLGALLRTIFTAGVLIAIFETLYGKNRDVAGKIGLTIFVAMLLVYHQSMLNEPWWAGILADTFFPRPMVLYTMLGMVVAARHFLLHPTDIGMESLILLLAFSSLIAFRLLFEMQLEGYSIYYNGPVVLAYLVLASSIVKERKEWLGRAFRPDHLLVIGCLAAVLFHAVLLGMHDPQRAPLRTDYGTLRVPLDVARNYEAGIRFLKDKNAKGESVLIVPEDTTMYFLSGTQAPTRVYLFTPGIVAPGRMTEELFGEIENKRVKHLLWSNRLFPEYGLPIFGKDFNQELAAYLRMHYRAVGPLVPDALKNGGLSFMVWKRTEEKKSVSNENCE